MFDKIILKAKALLKSGDVCKVHKTQMKKEKVNVLFENVGYA